MRARLEALEVGPIATGAVVGVAGLLVVGVAAGVVDVSDDGHLFLAVPLLTVALLGLAAAGWIAAGRSRRAPLVHGTIAATAAVLAAEGFVVVRRVIADEPIAWAAVVAWLLLAVACGLIGGRRALHPRRQADSPM